MQSKVLDNQPVRLAGELEDHDLQLLQKAVMDALQAADTDAVIDLSEVATLSSGAMALLRRVSVVLRTEGRRLVIISGKHRAARALDFDAVCTCMDCRGSAARTTESTAHEDTKATERKPADADAGSEEWYFEESPLF
ncbi:MAG TPA: STAS domain-containing protein [Planctomycetota bacterium]|nr:STAS domain-containing protein [Planctomycetota bacterium]